MDQIQNVRDNEELLSGKALILPSSFQSSP